MRRLMVILCLCFSSLFVSTSGAPAWGVDAYFMGDATAGVPGSIVSVPMLLSNGQIVDQFGVAVCSDPTLVQPIGVFPGPELELLAPAVLQTNFGPQGWTAMVQFDFSATPLLPGPLREMFFVDYVVQAPPPGVALLQFCDDVLFPPVSNQMLTFGTPIPLCELVPGQILIGSIAVAGIEVGSNVDGASIEVNPPDNNGEGGGITPFERQYNLETDPTIISFTAPAANDPANKPFLRWELDGEQQPYGKRTVEVPADGDHVVEAIYYCPVTGLDTLLDCAISIICKCFAECPQAQARQVQGGATVASGPTGKQIADCLKKLTDAFHPNNITFAELDAGTAAQASGDRTSDCSDKDKIQINTRSVPTTTSKCAGAFVKLVGLLYHEATHALQNWNEDTTSGIALDEVPAYTNESKVYGKMIAAINQIKANRAACIADLAANAPTFPDALDADCWNFLTLCTTQQLCDMKDATTSRKAFVDRQITHFEGRLPNPAPARGAGARRSLSDSVAGIETAAGNNISASSDTSVITQMQGINDALVINEIDTGIPHPLALWTPNGGNYLLVGGTTRGFEGGNDGSGVVRFYDLGVDSFFDIATELTLVDNDNRLQAASHFTVHPFTQEVYVYDSILRTLTLLDDTNADGRPDTLVGDSIILDDAVLLSRIAVLDFTPDGQLQGRLRQGGVAHADFDLVVLRDFDNDGFYESGQRQNHLQLEQRYPSACTLPFAGKSEFIILGTPGNNLDVVQVDSLGNPVQTLATVVAGNDGEALVTLADPLIAGTFISLRDMSNALWTPPMPILPPFPVVYGANVTTGDPSLSTLVTVFGEALPPLLGIDVEGTIVSPLLESPTQIMFMMPPTLDPHSAPVFLLPLAGDPINALVFDYEVPLPLLPEPQLLLPPLPAQVGIPFPLDGSSSVPSGNGNALTDYVWTGSFEKRTTFGAVVDVVFETPGAHVVVLWVSDGELFSPLLTVTIDVSGSAPQFIRGDANGDGGVSLNDALQILNYLFLGGSLNCHDAGDFTDDGSLSLNDPLALLNYLFLGGAAPNAPFPNCGRDPSNDPLRCAGYVCP